MPAKKLFMYVKLLYDTTKYRCGINTINKMKKEIVFSVENLKLALYVIARMDAK